MPTPDPLRLAILTDLRQDAGLTLTQMARRCGLRGKQSHQTAGGWERGVYVPSERQRRTAMIGYLWDDLMLRTDPEKFEEVWTILVEEWRWRAINDEEWRSFTTQERPSWSEAVEGAASTTERAPYQAPPVPASFVGRTEEMATLSEQLLNSTGKPIAVVGMGGIGKTTMAAHAASLLRDRYKDGVLWAHTQVSDPLDVLNSWAKAYGHDYSGLADVQSRASAMRNLLADKETLIVLDDVSSPSHVQPLLPGHAGCAVLVTTRSEDVAAALGSSALRLPELSQASSVDLLARLAGQARLEAEPGEAETICTLLHNYPLAIEIVGQLLAARPRRRLADTVSRLQDAQGRLDLAIADRDVRTSFLVSWEALDASHRETFATLGVFEGRSFTAEALAGVLEVDFVNAVDRLETLAARSLVSFAEDGRYRQHPLLADFAREQLGKESYAWMRFAVTQLQFARECEGVQAHFAPEWDNIMAGMKTASDHHAYQMILEYSKVLTDPWITGARYGQARQGFAWAVDAARTIEDQNGLCFALCKWGRACFEQDDYDEARRLLVEAQEIAKIADNQLVHGESAFWIGRIALERGEYERADRFLNRSNTIYRKLEEPDGLTLVFYQQAQLHYDRGNLDATEELCQSVRSMDGEDVDQTIQAATLRLLADIDIELGNYEAAAEHCHQALELCERLQIPAEMAATYYSLAVVARMQGRLEEADRVADQSLRLCETLGLRAFSALVLYEQSRICTLQGVLDRAYRLCSDSIFIFRDLGRTYTLVLALNHLGQICYLTERLEDALENWQNALLLAEQLGHPSVEKIRNRLATQQT